MEFALELRAKEDSTVRFGKPGKLLTAHRTLTGERLTIGHLTMLPYCFSNPANSNSSSPYGTSVDDLFISSRKSYVAEGVR